ncbi:MAG TPA: TetR family transcriptional regulator [Solirubrobacteraceae bacterium]|nr:TetR family transcriptional regulator [Solirubrobacteraceae bacterium]
MSSLDTPPATPTRGLRERKKQQTRDTIARAALRLFAERGYDETTLADIAAAADVAPRTIFAYFDSKEDILFSDEGSLDELKRRLDERPAGTTTVDALREFVGCMKSPDEDERLRKKVIMASPALQMKMRARHVELEPMLAQSIARDLGTGPDDIRALLVAASMTAAFESVSERFFAAESGGEPITHEQSMAILDEVLEFLRGGLEAIQRD